ncbi:urea transporter [Desulfococcaceae bacterium HSG7]|nr:urea transporter [Desulfococcaceae bacterium HSG7]
MKQYVKAIFNGYSEIFFLRNHRIGVLLFTVTLLHPNIALAGVISVIAAYLFARLINMGREFLGLGFYTYNPLLVGMAVGYKVSLTSEVILLLILTGIFTFIITIVMYSTFSAYLKLPVLSLPFVIVSSMVYLASSHYSDFDMAGLSPYITNNPEQGLSVWISGYFKSLGMIFFMPRVLPGLIIAGTLLATSRILFMLSVAGYYTGAYVTVLMTGSQIHAFTDMNHFNFILTAMTVGGIFLIPSLKSYTLALIAVCVSVLLTEAVSAFWSYKIPVFTLPFNLVSLCFVYVLGVTDYPELAKVIKPTPEETLDHYLLNHRRYRDTEKTILLPFSGKWAVWQGFDGQWTHQGAWKYAYDFIITDEEGRSSCGAGTKLIDYYAFRKPVLSPVGGRVCQVVSHLPDNVVGQVDKTDNWGNWVIIQDDRGFFVEISHFSENSIQVKEGQRVERGAFLGLCGNSGYSPQPHIHIQVQEIGVIGAYTVPFSFVSYANDNFFHSGELPAEGAVAEQIYWNTHFDVNPLFIMDDVCQYEVFKEGKKINDLTLSVKMAPDGTYYFDSGKGRLYFGKHEGTFYFYTMEGGDPYMETMMLALPRLPLACRETLQWRDAVPLGLVLKGFKKAAVQFISAFRHKFAEVEVELTYTCKNKIEGVIHAPGLRIEKKTFVEWEDQTGFKTVRVGDTELRRVGNQV